MTFATGLSFDHKPMGGLRTEFRKVNFAASSDVSGEVPTTLDVILAAFFTPVGSRPAALVEEALSIFSARNIDGDTIADRDVGTFGYDTLETNGLGLAWSASDVTAFAFHWTVPRGYDPTSDALKLRLLAQMGGTTDTPTLTAAVYKKKAGAALSADLAPSASAAITDTAAYVEIDLSGNTLVEGDNLFIVITPGAHTTDELRIFGALMQWADVRAAMAEAVVMCDETLAAYGIDQASSGIAITKPASGNLTFIRGRGATGALAGQALLIGY